MRSGGLVLQTLSRDFLGTWSKWRYRAPPELVHYYFSGVRTPERHDIVIITQVLGYCLSKFVGIKVISDPLGARQHHPRGARL